MQTVFPGERKLKKRLMRQMWKEIFVNLIKRILRGKSGKETDKTSDD